jgi:UDP:flavonoid glycosyltransferase YjiC (YdhE family)
MLSIGDELRARGHSVAITVNSNMVDWARRSGLDIVELGLDLQSMFETPRWQKLLATGKLTAMSRGFSELEHERRTAIAAGMKEACEGADVVVSSLLTGYRGLHFAERLRRPAGFIFMVPFLPTTRWCHPLFPIRRLPLGALSRATFGFVYWLRWRDTIAATRALREELGLPAVKRRPRFETRSAPRSFAASTSRPAPRSGPRTSS